MHIHAPYLVLLGPPWSSLWSSCACHAEPHAWQRPTQSHTVLWAAWKVWRLAAVHLVWRLVWRLAADRQADGHLHNRRPALSAQTLARAPAVLAEVGHCKRELHQCWPAPRQDWLLWRRLLSPPST